jgi:hypothetical protein
VEKGRRKGRRVRKWRRRGAGNILRTMRTIRIQEEWISSEN